MEMKININNKLESQLKVTKLLRRKNCKKKNEEKSRCILD